MLTTRLLFKFQAKPHLYKLSSAINGRKYAQDAMKESPSSLDKTKNLTEIEIRQVKWAEELKRVQNENFQLYLKKENERSLLINKSPKPLNSYIKLMRLNNTAPIYLTYWPGAWAILGAASYQAQTMPDFYLLGLFAAGAITMRSAGCIINDMWDRDLDRKVERTKDRPLANGDVGISAAVLLLGVNLSVSLAVLFQLNLTTQLLGACCLLPVAVYPAAKRFTNWPQAVLGVTFNWGALMGWSAVLCSTSNAIMQQSLLAFFPALVLYAGCINWTLFYDTIYAFQDKEHDKKLGLKSTAIHLEKNPKIWLLGFSSLFTSNMALFGWLTNQEPIYYMSLGLCMLQFLKQISMVDLNSPESCHKQFKSNTTIGALVGFGLLASLLIK